MHSTFTQAEEQTSQLGSLFSTDGFFKNNDKKDTNNTKGNNFLEGSGNKLQGFNNQISG